MKKLWKKVRGSSPARSGNSSPKSGSTRGSIASLNIGYEVREKDLTKLHKAAWTGNLNKVKQLARKDPSPLDKENRTPLHLACVQGNEHVVQELLEWKAKVNIGDNQSRTPLMRAVEFGQEGCVSLLLSYRVDIDTKDSQGNTALHLAVQAGNGNLVGMLLKAGASTDLATKEGFAPLHLAVQHKQEEVCRLLLNHRANVNIEDIKLRTPLMHACLNGSSNIVELLLQFNANTLHKDSKEYTADDCADLQGHHACSMLIRNHQTHRGHASTASTPRSGSWQHSSMLSGAHAHDSIGLPAQDAADDSDNETNSRASGAPGSDSWADSSQADEVDARPNKEGSDLDEDIFEDPKPAPKLNVAKFAKNIHISESETDGESVRDPTPKPVSSGVEEGQEEDEIIQSTTTFTPSQQKPSKRQPSWQSQTSGEDNSWGDSPVTPRKNSTTRVSFKKDEELSEVHDITPDDAEAKKLGKDTAMMKELGLSDVDDISDVSDDESAPALPASPPPPKMPATNQKSADSDWDTSVMSDIVTTPRPGILKKWNNNNSAPSPTAEDNPPVQESPSKQPAKLLLRAPAIESGDESSAWDTTEADKIGVQTTTPSGAAQGAAPARQHADSISEWDSDIEEMMNPTVPMTGTTPTPPPPLPTATITKEQKDKEATKDESDGEDWDSTVDSVTQKSNAGLQYKQINIDASQSEVAPIPTFNPSPDTGVTAVATSSTTQAQKKDEDDSDAWDSEEEDELKSEEGSPVYLPGVGGIGGGITVTAPEPVIPMTPGKGQQAAGGPQMVAMTPDSEDEEDDSESMSSWELQRKAEKQAAQLSARSAQKHQEEQEAMRREEEAAKLEMERRQQEEEEQERIRIVRERQEELAREAERQREWEELQRQEEENRIQRAREEEEEARERQREEEIKRQEEEEEMERQREEEMQRQWEEEEERKAEQRRIESQTMLEREAHEMEEDFLMRAEDVESSTDYVFKQQQELNRIDEQFQRERVERERREKEEEEKNEKLMKQQEQVEEEVIMQASSLQTAMETPPPALSPRVSTSAKTSQPAPASNQTSTYVNLSNSTVEQIRQRLQVVPGTSSSPASTLGFSHGAGAFLTSGDGFDDNESLLSENPGDERPGIHKSYYHGSMYRPNDPLDDDALSYTSTEFEDPVQSSPNYAKDRDLIASVNIGDPSSMLKVQEHVRETRRHLEQERNQRQVLENKVKVINKEKSELNKKLEGLMQQKSSLEQSKLDLEAKIRSLEYNMSEEEEKRKNAEILLEKTKEQLARKESQFSSELEAKQRAELTLRNLQIEMRTAANNIKELEEEKEELQRQISHSNNARLLQEQINEDQQKLLHAQTIQQQQQNINNRASDDQNLEQAADSDKLRAEVYALQMEMERQRSRFKDEVAMMGAENEELQSRVEELRNDIKLNEEALAHATMQYNMQVALLKSDVSNASASAERERSGKEKAEAELESVKTRLVGANHEKDKIVRARNELERDHRREKESWAREMDRKDAELTTVKDNLQHNSQRLQTTETKLNSMENEMHVSNTSLMERTAQLQQIRQDLDRTRSAHETLDQNYRLEKEQNAKLQAKIENTQEKLTTQQHENLSLRQQLDSLKLSGGGLPGSDANEKLNNILSNLRAESDRAKATLEEKNSSLLEQVARLKEESRGSEARRSSLEADLRRLQEEHSELVRRAASAEASMQVATKAKEHLEQERAALRAELDQTTQRYQAAHDKATEAQARVSELLDRLDKAESSSHYSTQQLANTSANMQGLFKSKSELDESMHQLQIDNARLEAELKYEKQRADMLQLDLQDSQKVRSSLEALCANLKSTSAHLEDRLGIADLERNKQTSESKLGEEKNRTNEALQERRSLENQLDAEVDKNRQLQKDVSTLKAHLKAAKLKIKGLVADQGGDVRAELEAKYRAELNRKLGEVNRFLESQSHLQGKLDTSRTEIEVSLQADKRRLEEENKSLRVRYEQAVAQRETKELEARRFRELYESEMKWRLRVSDQLQLATEKSFNLSSKLNNERFHRNRLTNNIGNLQSSLLLNNSYDTATARGAGTNGYHGDDLSNKIKSELDKSIARHLEAAPHDHHRPVLLSSKDKPRFSSALTQASHDYIDVLKRKYCV